MAYEPDRAARDRDVPMDQRLRIRKLALRFALGVAGATLALGAVVLFFQGQIAVAVHWYAVAIGVMLVGALDRLTAGALGSLGLGVLVATVTQVVSLPGSLLLTALGVTAAAVALALVATLVWRLRP